MTYSYIFVSYMFLLIILIEVVRSGCVFPVDEKADPSIPLYVLPLYSLLAPEQQAKVSRLSGTHNYIKRTKNKLNGEIVLACILTHLSNIRVPQMY